MYSIPTSPFTPGIPSSKKNYTQSRSNNMINGIKYQPDNVGIWVKVDRNGKRQIDRQSATPIAEEFPLLNPSSSIPNPPLHSNPKSAIPNSKPSIFTNLNAASYSIYQRFKSQENARKLINKFGISAASPSSLKPENKSVTSFLFFNFPDSWNSLKLWGLFKTYGDISEVYIPKKRLKNGSRFGFVRYKNIPNHLVDTMARKLSMIEIEGKLLVVYKAHNRNTHRNNPPDPYPSNNKPHMSNDTPKHGSDSFVDNRKFTDILNGTHTPQPSPVFAINNVNKEFSIKIPKDDKLIDLLGHALIGVIKNIEHLEYFDEICKSENLTGFVPKYLGGKQVLLLFDDIRNGLDVLNPQGFGKKHPLWNWFDDIKSWDPEENSIHSRLVWIDVKGVPITCWFESTFCKIAKC
ncbi:uncharacterized protein [Rutidosis leptorrhynchoides]|uniref:uncharacterized protein n=1 Tax=Rutidosis leptorrhynchoides TaxID=125765 RepID=UPI003A9A4BE2